MGLPAARAILDTGAHSGPITIGSPNVFIGGNMAAKIGDPVTCSLHGTASITTGSTTVFINGKGAARIGDTTMCFAPPIPAPIGKPPVTRGASLLPDEKLNKDGTLSSKTTGFEKDDDKLLYIGGQMSDTDGDGTYDRLDGQITLADYNTEGDFVNFNDGSKITGKGNVQVLNIDGSLSGNFGDGTYGVGARGKAVGAKLEGEYSYVGPDKKTSMTRKAKLELFSAEALGGSKIHLGGNGKWGYSDEVGAQAGVVGAEGEIMKTDPFFGTNSSIRFGVGAGALGAGAKIIREGYLDTNKRCIVMNIELAGELGIGIDLKFGFDFDYGSILDAIWGPTPTPPPITIPGVIISGCLTVFIGD